MTYDRCLDCGGRTIGTRCGPCKRARERVKRALQEEEARRIQEETIAKRVMAEGSN